MLLAESFYLKGPGSSLLIKEYYFDWGLQALHGVDLDPGLESLIKFMYFVTYFIFLFCTLIKTSIFSKKENKKKLLLKRNNIKKSNETQ